MSELIVAFPVACSANARQAEPSAPLLGTPWPLQTERLLLTLPDHATAHQLVSWAVDPQIAPSLWPQGRFNASTLVLALAAWQRDCGTLIGELRLRLDNGLLSYFVVPSAWGQGYATEMVRAVSDAATMKLTLPDVKAVVLRENVASRRVLEKSGFRFDGLTCASRAGGAALRTALRFVRRNLDVCVSPNEEQVPWMESGRPR